MEKIIEPFHEQSKLGRYFLTVFLSYITCRKIRKLEEKRTLLKEIYESNARKL
ncbi:hypothetical protein [Gracilibacillus xinjiangensis]|uniref:Uncharacterized protein n=1 Tax=Gracilibacillus xinjiangensis TaxID=1193282 RepID=A0ABV8X0Y6_9BACI